MTLEDHTALVAPPVDADGEDPTPARSVAEVVRTLREAVASAESQACDVPWWLAIRSPADRKPIGETLVMLGHVTIDDLDRALHLQRTTGRRVGETLVDMGVLSRFELAQALSDHFGTPFVDLEAHPPDMLLTGLIPEEFARRYKALPVQRWDRSLLVAMADPNDVFALDDLRVLTRREVVAAYADLDVLSKAIDRAYTRSEIASSVDDVAFEHSELEDTADADVQDEDGPVIRLVNALLEQAINDRASDVHIEPTSTHVRVRFRIDGVLHDASEVPLNALRPLVSRLKVLGSLDIAQSRVPQDGRFSLRMNERGVDVRVASVPTSAGEAVVLRLLDPERGVVDLAGLDLPAEDHERLLPAFLAAQGAVVITGPTGSGKSTTLYALMSEIDAIGRSVVSVEDPVEYRVDGIKQIQINKRAGMTFPSALRSILRADPDVILIGEVRDAETARIAADASITGHLVLSTLHTTRAAAAPMRLVDMGVEAYLVASALSCVAAQRLPRRLCGACAHDVESPDLDLLRKLGADDTLLEKLTVRAATGCGVCRRTGYHGRMALFEIMPIDEHISRMIVERAISADIERVAVEQGMTTLRQSALQRVASGDLSIDEMLRVVG